MRRPGNEHADNDEAVDDGPSYYYDDATGYEVYREDDDEEAEPGPEGDLAPDSEV